MNRKPHGAQRHHIKPSIKAPVSIADGVQEVRQSGHVFELHKVSVSGVHWSLHYVGCLTVAFDRRGNRINRDEPTAMGVFVNKADAITTARTHAFKMNENSAHKEQAAAPVELPDAPAPDTARPRLIDSVPDPLFNAAVLVLLLALILAAFSLI